MTPIRTRAQMPISPFLIVLLLGVVVGVYLWRRSQRAQAPVKTEAAPEEPEAPFKKRSRTFLTFFRVVGINQRPPGGALLVAPSQEEEQERKESENQS